MFTIASVIRLPQYDCVDLLLHVVMYILSTQDEVVLDKVANAKNLSRSRHMDDWSIDDLCAFFVELNMEQYCKFLYQNKCVREIIVTMCSVVHRGVLFIVLCCENYSAYVHSITLAVSSVT